MDEKKQERQNYNERVSELEGRLKEYQRQEYLKEE